MKTALSVILAAALLSGCAYKDPSRTFKWDKFECANQPAEIKLDAGVLGAIAKANGGSGPPPSGLSNLTLEQALQLCNQFLNGSLG